MKNANEKIPSQNTEDVKSLLEQYEEQVKDADVHAYSELLHHDYGDYSDSGCCC